MPSLVEHFRNSRQFFCLLLLLLVSACSPQQMFGGPAKKKAEVAIVRGWGVQLLSVNKIPVGVNSAGVVILPGANTFLISPNASNYHDVKDSSASFKLEMLAQAGVEYAITSKRGESRICAFPLSPSTGDPVFEKAAGCATR